jgi:hypothetical protein
MTYSSKDYAFIQHALNTNRFNYIKTKFEDGKIYVECGSDSLFFTLFDLVEAAKVNPHHINFCKW